MHRHVSPSARRFRSSWNPSLPKKLRPSAYAALAAAFLMLSFLTACGVETSPDMDLAPDPPSIDAEASVSLAIASPAAGATLIVDEAVDVEIAVEADGVLPSDLTLELHDGDRTVALAPDGDGNDAFLGAWTPQATGSVELTAVAFANGTEVAREVTTVQVDEAAADASVVVTFRSPGSMEPWIVGDTVPVEIGVEAEPEAPSAFDVQVRVGDEPISLSPDAGDPTIYSGTWIPRVAGTSVLVATIVDEADGTTLAQSETTVETRPADPFTFVVFPDTQNMNGDEANTMVERMVDWTVDSVAELGTVFVTHVGDLVDWGHRTWEWDKADASLSGLDGQVPYSVAFGDHDYRTEENMASDTAFYVERFGPDRYLDHDWYLGASPNGLSHAQRFDAGAWTFLHIALEWEGGPAYDVDNGIEWAQQVIDANPGLPTILTTHAYVWDEPGAEGRFPDSALEGYVGDSYPGSSGEEIFERLVAPNPQVFLVLGGHYHRGEGTSNGEVHQISEGSTGLPVIEMLVNYQDYPNGGDGWLRTLRFVSGGGSDAPDRIEARTYTPVHDEEQTDPSSAFHIDMSFVDRFGAVAD